GRRLAQRADVAEKPEVDLLQQVLAIGTGPQQASQRLGAAGREAVPGFQLRRAVATPERFRDLRVGARRRAARDQPEERRAHLALMVPHMVRKLVDFRLGGWGSRKSSRPGPCGTVLVRRVWRGSAPPSSRKSRPWRWSGGR